MGRGRGKGSEIPDEEDSDGDEDVARAAESDEEAVLFGAGVEEAGDGDDALNDDSARSLFGPETFESAAAFWKHAAEKHGFSLSVLREQLGNEAWTDYHRIRLVNYLRSLGPEAARSEAPRLGPKSAIWEDDKWLKPVLEDDLLLFEDDDMDEELDDSGAAGLAPQEAEAADPREEVARLRAELASMRRLLSEDDDDLPPSCSAAPEDSAAPVPPPTQQDDQTAELGRAFVLATGLAQGIRDMLVNEPALVEGQAVLDVDCGAGILACLCSQLGAHRITAVSRSAKASALAQSLAAANGCDDDITLSTELPMVSSSGPAYGLVVSERLLSDPLYSPSLPILLGACQRHLRQEGRALPVQAILQASAGDFSAEADRNEAWRRPCAQLGGLDLSALLPDGTIPPRAEFTSVGSDRLASVAAAEIFALDVASAEPKEALPVCKPFRFELHPKCCMTAVVLALQINLVPGEQAVHAEPRRHLVLHLPAQGPPPRRSLRLPGCDYPVVEGHLSACQESNGGPLEICVELSARHAGSRGSELRTSALFTVP